MFGTIARFLAVFALVLGTSGPAFARMMPMPMTQAAMTALACVGQGCAGHRNPGHSRHSPTGARCIAPACTSVAALPIAGAGTVAFIDTALTYHPPVAPSHLGLRPIPDALPHDLSR
ncbi:MAG: hypothetical protein ACYCZB_15965 [Acidiphilium sp.]